MADAKEQKEGCSSIHSGGGEGGVGRDHVLSLSGNTDRPHREVRFMTPDLVRDV